MTIKRYYKQKKCEDMLQGSHLKGVLLLSFKFINKFIMTIKRNIW